MLGSDRMDMQSVVAGMILEAAEMADIVRRTVATMPDGVIIEAIEGSERYVNLIAGAVMAALVARDQDRYIGLVSKYGEVMGITKKALEPVKEGYERATTAPEEEINKYLNADMGEVLLNAGALEASALAAAISVKACGGALSTTLYRVLLPHVQRALEKAR